MELVFQIHWMKNLVTFVYALLDFSARTVRQVSIFTKLTICSTWHKNFTYMLNFKAYLSFSLHAVIVNIWLEFGLISPIYILKIQHKCIHKMIFSFTFSHWMCSFSSSIRMLAWLMQFLKMFPSLKSYVCKAHLCKAKSIKWDSLSFKTAPQN